MYLNGPKRTETDLNGPRTGLNGPGTGPFRTQNRPKMAQMDPVLNKWVTLPFTVRLLHSNYCVTTMYLPSNYKRNYMYLNLITHSYKRNYTSVTTA